MSTPDELPRWARGHAAGLEYHRGMLDDPHRMHAYEAAIRRLVRPGDVVLDIGSGTGILAMLAARRGAVRVHAVESMAIADLARELVAENGLSDRVIVHHADFATLDPLEPVDLVISEFMGRFVVDDGMLPVVARAARWMKPDARFCPAAVELFLAPVGDIHLRAVDFTDEAVFGVTFRAATRYTLNFGYHAALGPQALMAAPRLHARLEPPDTDRPLTAHHRFTLQRAGRLQGLAGWFRADLAPGVALTTEPGIQSHWGQYLLPLPPTPVEPDDTLEVELGVTDQLTAAGQDLVFHWQGQVVRQGAQRLRFALESTPRLGERPPP